MKKHYSILINTEAANDYIEGRIRGIIYALSGMPEREYAHYSGPKDALIPFDATEEQSKVIHECLNKLYPKAYVGMRAEE